MALPSLSTPEFITTIPSSGKEIKYRPFLVKEEKILLMALEGNDTKEINTAILKILKNCILSDIDVNTLATFDIEFLFLRLRGKSVGEKVELQITHQKGECRHRTDVEVDLDDVSINGEIHDGKLMLTDSVGVKFRYPGLGDIYTSASSAKKGGDQAAAMYDMIVNCVEFIFDETEVYSEFSKKEIESWLETLTAAQFKVIASFFEEIPKLRHKIEWKCEHCGKDDSIVLEGLESFFT